MLDELSLSEQAAVADDWTRVLLARAASLLNRLEPPATGLGVHPPVVTFSAGGSNLLPHAEEPAMVEKLVTNHPPLQVCYPGHHPHLWQANGECSTTYFVECSVCGVRTRRYAGQEAASHAWAHRDVVTIPVKAVA